MPTLVAQRLEALGLLGFNEMSSWLTPLGRFVLALHEQGGSDD